jgi:hypothetical protein
MTTDGLMRHHTWQVRETVHRVYSAIQTTAAWLEEEEGEEGEEGDEGDEGVEGVEGEEEHDAAVADEAADEAADEVAGATLGDGEEEVMEEALCHLAKAAGAA